MLNKFPANSLIIMLFIFISAMKVSAQSLEWQGQASSWLTLNPDSKFEGQLGIRYLPTVSVQKSLNDKWQFDGELAGNIYGGANHYYNSADEINGKIKPYRLWVRFTNSQLELRAGLQKINFGSATLLRALMWFDRIDPRDPLQLTDGIYGLLGRYYFLNNTNIWLWGLYGNDDTRGREIFPSAKEKPEFGARLQVPVWTGEIAISGHHRTAISRKITVGADPFSENRFAFDGKWDMGIGLWFESVIIYSDLDSTSLRYNRMLNLGMDYTFNFGNGLHILTEYLRIDISDKPFDSGKPVSLLALSINYPVGLLDKFSAIFYYEGSNQEMYRFINWQRTYDQWSFYAIGFWNPHEFQIYQNQQSHSLFTGKGIQLMAVFNH